MLWEKHKLAIINNYTASNSCITSLLLQNVSFIAHTGTSQTGAYTCIYFFGGYWDPVNNPSVEISHSNNWCTHT